MIIFLMRVTPMHRSPLNRGMRAVHLSRNSINMQKRDKLLQELDMSLAIKAFWPEAFLYGSCSSCLKKVVPEGFKFRIYRGDHDHRDWDLNEVPVVLLARPHIMRPLEEMDLHQHRKIRRRIQKHIEEVNNGKAQS